MNNLPSVHLAKETEGEMLRYGLSTKTAEVCGLLLGHILSPTVVEIDKFIAVPNIAKEPLALFIMDPTKQLEIYERAHKDGLSIIGCFHSHPLWSNMPSETDRRMIRDDKYLWIIYGGVTNALASHWGMISDKELQYFIPAELRVI